jgi:hypothetical protein
MVRNALRNILLRVQIVGQYLYKSLQPQITWAVIHLFNQQMHTYYSLLYNTIYRKTSPTCFEALFWDHHRGLGLWIT